MSYGAVYEEYCVLNGCLSCPSVGPSGEDESQEDVLMDEAPSNMSQASTLQANREGNELDHNALNPHKRINCTKHLSCPYILYLP